MTGGSGQVAWALGAQGGATVRVLGRPEFDFDRPESIGSVFRTVRPSVVINAAAYTAVDAAETDEAAAMRANRDGPAALAGLCREAGVPLVHISTDYVFDGRKGAPYLETDAVAPQGVYGASKLAGEQAVLTGCERAVVVRTGWVYAHRGRNFLLTMLNAARKTGHLRVVADQLGSPTAAGDLAGVLLGLPFVRDDGARWRGEDPGRVPCGGLRGDDLARVCLRDFRGGGAVRGGGSGRGADSDGGLADRGEAAGGLAAELRQAGTCVRGATAGLARRGSSDG